MRRLSYINVLLDDKRLETFKGTPLESEIKGLFGGKLKAFQLSVPDEVAKTILSEFTGTRTDSRNFIEGLPVSFKRALYSEIAAKMSVSADVFDGVLKKLGELKEAAKLESEYIPPP